MVDWVFPIVICLIILFICTHLAMSYDKAKNIPVFKPVQTEKGIIDKEYFNSKAMFTDFTNRISNNADEITFTESTPKFLLGGLFFCLIIGTYLSSSQKKLITGKEYGSACWGKLSQVKYLFSSSCYKVAAKEIKKNKKLTALEKKERIKELKMKYESSDILLSKTEKLCLYHTDSLNNNTLVIAGSGGGKTTGYAMPNILQVNDSKYSPSLVLTDPKGENLQRTGYYLQKIAKYKVNVLNLKDQKMSCRYNPFKYINIRNDAGELQNQVRKLANCIMTYQADLESSKGDEFWTDMAILCTESLLLATHYGFPVEEQNMNTVMELFEMLQIDENEDSFNSELDFFFELYDEKFKDYADALYASRKYWEFRKKCRGRTANSVLATMQSKLNPFDNKNIKRIFSGDDMELEKLGEEQIAIFIVLPPMEKTFNFIANMLYVQMFDMIEYTATVKNNQKLPVPVKFILDEFYNTGKIPEFKSILSYARSFGVSISVIIQSIDQLKEMYKESWGTIVDNCSTMLYLGGMQHVENLEYISKKIGDGTFDKKNRNRSRGKQSSTSVNEDRLGRALMKPDEVAKLNNRNCILFMKGYPFYSKKNYFKFHKNYKYTWDANKKNEYIYTSTTHGEEIEKVNVELKEIKVEYQQENIAEYLSRNLTSLDFDDCEVDEDEVKEVELMFDIVKENDEIQNTMNSILKKVVSINSDSIKVAKEVFNEVNSSSANYQFDNEEFEDGEPKEEFELDLNQEIEMTTNELFQLEQDFIEDMGSFLNSINDLDVNDLESLA